MPAEPDLRTVARMTPYLASLHAVPGLEQCSRRELESIGRVAERITVAAGQPLIEPDDRWTGTCIIERGEAVAQIPGWTVLLPAGSRIARRNSNPGDLRVVARTDLDVLCISRRRTELESLAV